MDKWPFLQLTEHLYAVENTLVRVFVDWHSDKVRIPDTDDGDHDQHRLKEWSITHSSCQTVKRRRIPRREAYSTRCYGSLTRLDSPVTAAQTPVSGSRPNTFLISCNVLRISGRSHHSVRISVRYVDNMMTLYRLRRPSGRPPDDI